MSGFSWRHGWWMSESVYLAMERGEERREKNPLEKLVTDKKVGGAHPSQVTNPASSGYS